MRILTLSENFFGHFSHEADHGEKTLDGFTEAIDRAQDHVDRFGVPVCDFTVFDPSKVFSVSDIFVKRDPILAFQRAVNRAKIVSLLFKPKKNYNILSALKQLKEMKKIEE